MFASQALFLYLCIAKMLSGVLHHLMWLRTDPRNLNQVMLA